MATVERELGARLGAARLVLEGRSGDIARIVSAAQAKAVKRRDAGLKSMNHEVRVRMVDLAVGCSWVGEAPPENGTIVTELPATPTTPTPTARMIEARLTAANHDDEKKIVPDVTLPCDAGGLPLIFKKKHGLESDDMDEDGYPTRFSTSLPSFTVDKDGEPDVIFE